MLIQLNKYYKTIMIKIRGDKGRNDSIYYIERSWFYMVWRSLADDHAFWWCSMMEIIGTLSIRNIKNVLMQN